MTATVGDIATLAWGYTMADVDTLTRRAYNKAKNGAGIIAIVDRWEAAWFGIVEHLYAVDERPEPDELVKAGAHAVREAARECLQSHGLREGGNQRGSHFERYWRSVNASEDDFTERLAERLALPQVLGQLTDKEYEAISALAVHGSNVRAAAALGVGTAAQTGNVLRARRKILEAWFSPETPRQFAHKSPDACRYGHARAEYGRRNAAGAWECLRCRRTNHVRAYYARKQRVAEAP